MLYPAPMNPEACYEIDELIEYSESQFPKFNAYLGPVSDEQAKELAEGPFRDLMFRINDQLKQNQSPNYLVGY